MAASRWRREDGSEWLPAFADCEQMAASELRHVAAVELMEPS